MYSQCGLYIVQYMARLLSLPSAGGITWELFPCPVGWYQGLSLLPWWSGDLISGAFHDLIHINNNVLLNIYLFNQLLIARRQKS